jgi:hypothetical protein
VPDRIGFHEIKPGIWAGLHAHISPEADLRPPCWVGENVYVGAGAIIGPNAILETSSFIDRGAEIAHSIVCTETFVGEFMRINHSIALGDTLVDWKLGSTVKVPDDFLLCSLSLHKPAGKGDGLFTQLAAALALLLSVCVDWLPMLRRSARDVLK